MENLPLILVGKGRLKPLKRHLNKGFISIHVNIDILEDVLESGLQTVCVIQRISVVSTLLIR